MNEAQQLATTPFLRTAVTEANRTYEGKDATSIQDMIKDWQQRWQQRDKRSEFPLFINRIVTNYLIRWHDIRKSDYVGILVTDQQGALVVSSIPQVEYFYGKTPWWQAVVKGSSQEPYVSEITFDPSFGTHVRRRRRPDSRRSSEDGYRSRHGSAPTGHVVSFDCGRDHRVDRSCDAVQI